MLQFLPHEYIMKISTSAPNSSRVQCQPGYYQANPTLVLSYLHLFHSKPGFSFSGPLPMSHYMWLEILLSLLTFLYHYKWQKFELNIWKQLIESKHSKYHLTASLSSHTVLLYHDFSDNNINLSKYRHISKKWALISWATLS